MKKINSHFIAILVPLFLFIVSNAHGQDTIVIQRQAPLSAKIPIPISIEGFSGEGLEVLKFDLYVQGFSFRPGLPRRNTISEAAMKGMSIGRVSLGGKEILSRSYTGASIRRKPIRLPMTWSKPSPAKKASANGKIAFKVQEPNGNGEIYVADFDGHNAQAVTTDGAIVAAPAWVPGQSRALLYFL